MRSRMAFHLGASVTACVLCLPLGCVGSPVIADETLPPAADDIERREVWIAMPDGVRLAADLYLPKKIQPAERFPVLLEYIPYRKTESLAAAAPPDVDARHDVAATNEVGGQGVRAAAGLRLAVGNIFQQHGQPLSGLDFLW